MRRLSLPQIPLGAKVVILLVAGYAAALAGATALSQPPKVAPAPPAVETPVTPTAQPDVKPVQGPVADAAKKLLLKTIRRRALDRAVSDGVTVPGGGKLKLTRDEAAKAMAEVDDELILAHVAETYGEKVYAGRLEDFVKWLWDNREAIVAFVMKILALFMLAV